MQAIVVKKINPIPGKRQVNGEEGRIRIYIANDLGKWDCIVGLLQYHPYTETDVGLLENTPNSISDEDAEMLLREVDHVLHEGVWIIDFKKSSMLIEDYTLMPDIN